MSYKVCWSNLNEKKLYYCDCTKNINCAKTHCFYLTDDGECKMTVHKRFARNADDYILIQDIKNGKGLKPLS